MPLVLELLGMRNCTVAYTSLRRVITKRGWGKNNRTTVRLADTEPGEVAEMDFSRSAITSAFLSQHHTHAFEAATGRRRQVHPQQLPISVPCPGRKK